MTKDEWQDFFNTNFPIGAHFTAVKTSEHAVASDDSPQYLIAPVRVRELNEQGQPELSLFIVGIDRELFYTLDHTEPRPWGYALFPARDSLPVVLLSNKLTDDQKEQLTRK